MSKKLSLRKKSDWEILPDDVPMAKNGIKTDPQGYWDKENIEIKNSKIHGKGVFSKLDFSKNDIIGLAHENGQPVTNLGKFYNHSEKPNTESILINNKRILKPLKKIKKGEEITVNYRKQPELEQPENFSFDGSGVVELPLAQNGLNIKDNITKINGEWYNQDIIDGLERNERVNQNSENRFLNQFGVVDRNEFYNKFPFEEHFNFEIGRYKANELGSSKKYLSSDEMLMRNGGNISSEWEIMQQGGEIKNPINEFRPKFANSNENIQNNLRLKEELGQRKLEKYQRDVAGQKATQQAVKNISSLNLKPKSEAFTKPVQELGLTQDNRYSPVNPLFTPLAPQWTNPNDQKSMKLATFLTQDNALQLAGEALSTVPFSRLLKGVKPSISSSVDDVGKGFKSEIDWAKWNKEIPENKALIQEYNAIEQQTKTTGTWMKNPDGSAFQGTPEQFVQQNSKNFKKAFGNSKLVNPDGSPTIQYHGSAKKFDTFDESKFQLGDAGYSGQGIYTTPSKTTANSYATSSAKFHSGKIEPTVYELYGQANNPISSSQLIKEGKGRDLFNFHRKRNWKGELTPEESLLEFDAAISDQLPNVQNIRPWYDAREIVFPRNTQLKSAIGNNGMFDMTNSNIYKALVPAAIGTGAASQIEQKQSGGKINSNWEIIQD
jgi:hypothetical protein